MNLTPFYIFSFVVFLLFCKTVCLICLICCRSVADNLKNWYDLYLVHVVFVFELDLLTLTWLQVLFIVTVTLHFVDQGSRFSKVGSYEKTLHKIRLITIWIWSCSVILKRKLFSNKLTHHYWFKGVCVFVCVWLLDKLVMTNVNNSLENTPSNWVEKKVKLRQLMG